MDTPAIFILIFAVVWLIFALLFRREHLRRRLTPLSGLAFACVLAGIFFAEKQVIGYAFLGAGILLAFLDMILRVRRK